MPRIDVRRAGDRFRHRAEDRDAWYSFSYAGHYDAANTHHGVLLAHNDETLAPGAGYGEHPHRHLEILTWVVDGRLTHQDSTGATTTVPAGWLQLLSTGDGVTHAETNQHTEPARYVQMWVVPDGRRTEPSYRLHPLPGGELTPPLELPGQPDATFAVGRPGATGLALPAAPFLHLFVATGTVDVDGAGRLGEGDAVRLTDAGEWQVSGSPGSEIGIWAMGSALGG